MRKICLFLLFALSLSVVISCNHAVLPASDNLPEYTPDSIPEGSVKTKGEVLSFGLSWPPAPREAGADRQKPWFRLTLSSSTVEGFEDDTRLAHPGDTVTFSDLLLGDYTITCFAWDESTGLCYSGKTDVTVEEGENTAILNMNYHSDGEHIKVEKAEIGVNITISGINPDTMKSISVCDFTGESDGKSPYFKFELDDGQMEQICAGGTNTYTFNWPFAPMLANGQKRGYYAFLFQYEGAEGIVQEKVCCLKGKSSYALNLADYEKIACDFTQNGKETSYLPGKFVSLKNVSLETLRNTVIKVPSDEIGEFKAVLEVWGGNFQSFGAGNSVIIPKSGNFEPENQVEDTFRRLLKGELVEILSDSFVPSTVKTCYLNEILGSSGRITPNFKWQFSLTDAPYGWFQLPEVNASFYYRGLQTKVSERILSVEKTDEIIYLTVNVPSDTSYLEIHEEGTTNSYAFTSKDSQGKLTCSGKTVTIPWAFYIPSNSYAAFTACCTSGSSYTYTKDTVCLYGEGTNGGIFNHSFLAYGGEPVIGRDIIIDSSNFKVSMPQGKMTADYKLDFPDSGCEVADSSIVYSLCFTDTDFNMDLRFNLSGNIPDETVQLFDSSVKYDVRSSESIYWSNNDEKGGVTSFGQTQEYPDNYMYSLMKLQSNPAFKTKGALSYRLKYSGKYIDSGEEDSWLGEYRIALWDQGGYTQMTAYPPAEQTARATAGTKVGISMPTQYLQRWNKDGDNMKNLLEADGYTVDLEFAGDSELNLQIEQIKDMVDGGCDVLIVAAVDGSNLSDCLAEAKNKGVKVIAYDRLISNTDAVSYYTTFNNWNVGVLQGEYIESALKLKTASGPFYMEFFTGDPGDNNINFFFDGAMSILTPYINSGKIVCLSGQTAKAQAATPGWSSDNAQSRMEDLIVANGYAPAGQKLDAVLCSNDSTAQGVITALKEVGYTAETMPFVTGQDCDKPSVEMILMGEQSMSVFKDTRILAAKAVEMAESILKGNGVLVNDVSSYYNGTGCIPTLLVDSVYCDISNYQQLLLDSGYYSAESLLENYVTLNVLSYGYEGDAFEDICNEFRKENPFIILKYEQYYDEDYHDQVADHINSENIPDIAYMGADARWGGAWQEAGLQVDNTDYIPENIEESLIPDFFGTGEKPYIPDGGLNFCSVVGVNMKLLKQIGGKLPTTYDEFKELAHLCNENGIKCLSTHGADAWVWGSCVMSGIIPRTTGNPAWIENAVNSNASFTDDDFVAALDVLAQWVADGILDPDSVNTDDWTGKANFANGEYLMYIDGQWGFSQNNYGDLAENITLIPIPQVPGEEYCKQSVASTWQPGYGITSAGASNQDVLEAAKKWLKCYHSYDATVQRMGAISSPILKDFTVTDDMDPFVDDKLALNKYSSCEVIDSWLTGTANDKLNEGMQAIVAGTMSASEVAMAVQRAFEAQNQ